MTARLVHVLAQVVLLAGCEKRAPSPAGVPEAPPARASASVDSAKPPPIPPILDFSSEYVCFAADKNERERSLVGWVMPLPNRDKPEVRRGTNPFTKEEVVVLDYSNPVEPPTPSSSAHPEVAHLPRAGSVLLGSERLALLIHAIDGTPADDAQGQIWGQKLLRSSGELGEVFRVPQHFVQVLARVAPTDVAVIAARWKPSLAAGPEHGDEASQPPLVKRTETLSAAKKLSVLALETKRDLFVWEIDF